MIPAGSFGAGTKPRNCRVPDPDQNPDARVIVTSDGRLAGCSGRALVATLLVVLVFLLVAVMLIWGLREESQPIPATAPAAPSGL